jgi:DNA polymerase-3 subunit alpha
MAVVLLDDGTAQQEVTLFSEMYDEYRELIRDDRPLVVQARVRRDDFSGGVRVSAERVFDLGGFRAKFGKGLRLSMNGEANARRLHDLLSPFRKEGLPVMIDYHRDGAACLARLGPEWQVRPDEQLIDDLRAWLRPENVQVEYA